MDEIWEKLYKEAMSVLNPHDVSGRMCVGSVGSAVLTKKGNIYKVMIRVISEYFLVKTEENQNLLI